MPSDKTVSIAAPASFWYLKGFPIRDISKVVDYIVYMTYDLHGQWDYNGTSSDPGCPGPRSNCLRSHVNNTETFLALSMITKAGVPSNNVVVGVASYGRSFEMVDPSCTGPNCHFTGPESGASKGRCSETAGYISNAELYEIIAQHGGSADGKSKRGLDNFRMWSDSESDYLTYGRNWVGFMSPGLRMTRALQYQFYHFGGTTDWAIDLAKFMVPFDSDHPDSCDVNWRHDYDCAFASNVNKGASTRWCHAGCSRAWDAAVDDWNDGGHGDNEFSQELGNFFNASSFVGSHCNELEDDNNCNGDQPSCGQPLSPAGYLIITSISWVGAVRCLPCRPYYSFRNSMLIESS